MRLVFAAVICTLLFAGCSGPPAGSDPVVRTSTSPVPSRWLRTLDQLDAVRSDAYAGGDIAKLARAYVTGSRALRADRRVLSGYVTRGLSLDGADLEILDLQVVWQHPDRVALRVVERLRPGHAAMGSQTVALPRDQATERVIVLARTTVGWRIDRVRRIAG